MGDVGVNDGHGLQVGAEVPGAGQVEPEEGADPAVCGLGGAPDVEGGEGGAGGAHHLQHRVVAGLPEHELAQVGESRRGRGGPAPPPPGR